MERAEWLLAGALALAFAPALLALADVWSALDYQSHGYLVPLVALWAAWSGGSERAGLSRRRDARGAALLAVALTVYGLGLAAGSAPLQGLALVGAVAGGVLWMRGAAWLRALAFPVAFLLFMVPIPPDWIRPLIVKLQLFVSEASVTILQPLGVGVARQGNVLRLAGGESLFVAEACSGVTSVVTLTPLAVLLAWLLRTPPARALVLVAAVVPIAMAANLLRVTGTVLAAGRFGVDVVTEASLHELAGLGVYVLGCLVLVALAGALAPARAAPR